MYDAINKEFEKKLRRAGRNVEVRQSHGGSGKQGRAVLEGLRADVVTLALGYDIDVLAKRGKLLATNWQERLPMNSCPYTSTIVFVVRQGNPREIRDWPDIARAGVGVVIANPKTSGGARWGFLAGYGYALQTHQGDHGKARSFMARVLANVPVLDAGARSATMSFVKRGIGDVLVAWESEALMIAAENGSRFEVVYPSASILAEPPVAVVERNARRRGTVRLAQEYLDFLYSPGGQKIIGRFYFRTAANKEDYREIKLFTVEEIFGGWFAAHQTYFTEGGVFDQLYLERFQ